MNQSRWVALGWWLLVGVVMAAWLLSLPHGM